MHDQSQLLLMAVDEAHCISSWGHDFRKEFRLISDFRTIVPACPIMALTATAVPRVRDDIIKTLSLRTPHVSNLEINVTTIKASHEAEVAQMSKEIRTQPIDSSTIVYCATTKEVDSLCEQLRSSLEAKRAVVKYHGKMGPVDRKEAHVAFLTGKAPVIVATEAFGMGIDKPDIRRIYNFGPPKTFESYYQQIGRAGRDGLPASCTLIFSDSQFVKYQDSFYTAKLTSPGALEAYQTSSGKFRAYANDMSTCRRAAIIAYLSGGKETPSFGARCGTCDTCRAARAFGSDNERDFTEQACGVFRALQQKGGSSTKTQLVEILKKSSYSAKVPGGNFANFYKEFLPMLRQSGFLVAEGRKSGGGSSGGFQRSYEILYASPKAQAVMIGHANVMLPVPQCIRQSEAAKAAKIKAMVDELKVGGIDTRNIPQDELKAGDGPVLKAELHWLRLLERTRKSNPTKAGNLETLAQRISEWRAKQAHDFTMAPGAVLANHLIKSVAYAQPTSVDTLRALGVRVGALDALIVIIADAKTEFGWNQDGGGGGSSSGGGGSSRIKLAPGVWGPAPGATKQIVAKKPPHWLNTHARFVAGESVETIAVTGGARGQVVQVNTIIRNLTTALMHGKKLDVRLLAMQAASNGVPTQDDWRQFDAAVHGSSIDISQDPVPSLDILGTISEAVKIPYAERDDRQKTEASLWQAKLSWFVALRRCQYDEAILLAADKVEAAPAPSAGGGGGCGSSGGWGRRDEEEDDEMEQLREMEDMEAAARDAKRRKVEATASAAKPAAKTAEEIAAAKAAEEQAMIDEMMNGLDESAFGY